MTAQARPTSDPAAATPAERLGEVDLVVVGAGILGLAHAWHAINLGLRVAVVERDERAVGASVRNFGHVCVTGQAGIARDYAEITRGEWLQLGALAGLSVRETGTIAVAKNTLEEAVLAEFADAHDGEAIMLDADSTARATGVAAASVRAGAHLPRDLRVDPLVAVGRIAEYLRLRGVQFHFGTNVGLVQPDEVRTSHGVLRCRYVAVAVGHDVDRLFPQLADEYQIERCWLRMLEVRAAPARTIDPAIFTGLSLLRYDAFRDLTSTAALRAQIAQEDPEPLEHDINHMITQRLDGALIVGDTHHRARTESPFEDERSDELLLRETARLFADTTLRVSRRWRGVYATSEHGNFLCATPLPGVRVACVTSGIGMTTSFGFARSSLETLVEGVPPGSTV